MTGNYRLPRGMACDCDGSGCDSTVSDFTAGKLPPKLSDRGADVRGRQGSDRPLGADGGFLNEWLVYLGT